MLAPLAVSVTDPPVQIVGALGLIVMVGFGVTVIFVVAEFVHPAVVVPTTE